MAAENQISAGKSEAGPSSIPQEGRGLRARLHAWWEGYIMPNPPKLSGLPKKTAEKATAEPASVPAARKDAWSPERIVVGQLIWGDGFTFPGGGEFAADLAKALIVDKRATVIDIGCGLGGGTRTIVERYGAQAHGFDLSPELAKAGDGLSAKAGLDLRAPIARFDLSAPDWKKGHYDAALVRNVLSIVTDKVALVRHVADTLKRGGRLVLLDWALADDEKQGTAFSAYVEGEPNPPYLGTLEQLVFLIESAGFTVRTGEDYTDAFRPIVLEGWSRIGTMVGKGMLNPTEGKALLHEAQLWARRVAALQSGELRVARIEALKKA
jgi:SAM-dependent methyltransferase